MLRIPVEDHHENGSQAILLAISSNWRASAK
jgi:hypothetical protein